MAIILKMYFAVFLALIVLTLCASVTSIAIDASLVAPEKKCNAPVATEINCNDDSLACGWVVYEPFTKKTNYSFKNRCECGVSELCVRSWDDVQKNAYVYHCKLVDAETFMNVWKKNQ